MLDIRVNYGEAIKKIAEYREAIAQVEVEEKKYIEMLKRGEITQQEYLQHTSALKIEKKQYTEQVRVLNREVGNEIKRNGEVKDSLVAMRAELSNLTREFDNMSKAEREGAAGQELQAHIKGLSDEIKAAEYATNRFYRNVGNYPKEVIATIRDTTIATGSLKAGLEAGSTAVMGLSKQLLKLLANPVVAFFAAIAAVVMGVVKVFNDSEERTNRMKQAMSALEPIVNGLKNALGMLADAVVSLIEVITSVTESIVSFGAEVLNFIGIQNDYNEKVEESKRLEQERQAEIKRSREFMVEEAEAQVDVAKLRDKVAQKDKYTREERLAFLDQAIAIERKIADERMAIAKANYENLVREARMTENDAEMNNKLAQAKRDLAAAELEYYNSTRRMQQQRAGFVEEGKREEEAARKQAASAAKSAASSAKQRAQEAARRREQEQKEKERAEKDSQTKEMKALQEAEDALIALIADAYEQRVTQTKVRGEREIEALRQRLETEQNLTETAREAINQTIVAKQQALEETLNQMEIEHSEKMDAAAQAELDKQAELAAKQVELEKAEAEERKKIAEETAKKEMELMQARYDFAASIFGGLSKVADQFAEDNKALAKLAKVLALGEIAINTGKAIAVGVANAQAVGFPANLAAIATTVATVLANMAAAISTVKSAKFAKGGTVEAYAGGGYVSGPGTGTSDSISARLSNGESVNTALSTQMFGPILSSMNMMAGGNAITGGGQSGIGIDMLAAAFAKGASMLPAPVVSVAEVTEAQNRVAAIERISTL